MKSKLVPEPKSSDGVEPHWFDEVQEIISVMVPLQLTGGIPAINEPEPATVKK